MRRGALWLVIGIPLASVVLCAGLVYLAASHPDPVVETREVPLSKTSWRAPS